MSRYICTFIYVYVNVFAYLPLVFMVYLLIFSVNFQKIRTVELDGKTVKLQIVSRSCSVSNTWVILSY